MTVLTVKRKAYRRKDGTLVKGSTYSIKDRGAPGRTLKSKQFFKEGVHSGWKKGMPAVERRTLVFKAHGRDYLSAARSKQQLANITTDKATKKAAIADAKYFYRMYHSKKGG